MTTSAGAAPPTTASAGTSPAPARGSEDRHDDLRPLLLLLPYAGAARIPVQMVRRGVGPDVEVVSPTLPGHGRRIHEEPFLDAEGLLGWLSALVADLGSRPLVLAGISMGGRLAYELAWRLTDFGTPPRGLVTCVSRAPHTGIGHGPLADLPLTAFQRAAVDHGLLARELAELPGSEPFVRALRADLAVLEDMPPCRARVLDVPTAVLGADADWLVPETTLQAWGDVVRNPVHLRVPGGHLTWLQDEAHTEPAFCRAVGSVLASPADK